MRHDPEMAEQWGSPVPVDDDLPAIRVIGGKTVVKPKLRREDQPFAPSLAGQCAFPPRLGLGAGHRPDEVDRGAALDGVDQQVHQPVPPGLGLLRRQKDDAVVGHGIGSRVRMTA